MIRPVGNSSDLLEHDQAVYARHNYAYSPNEKNILFSVVAIGAMVAVYPVMWLIQKFGTRSIVTLFGFFSALCTALIPLCAYLGFYWMVVMRFLQGTGLSTGFILIGTVTRQWSMQKQSAFFIAFLTCFFQTVQLPCLTDAALLVLDRQQGFWSMIDNQPAILTSNAIIAVWISAIANFMGIQVTMQFSPIYLNKVMGFPVHQTGLFSAVPQIVTFGVKIFAGVLADKASCCQPVTSVKIFNLISVGGMGIAFFVLAVIPTQHNHFVMGVNSFLNCMAALLAPVVVNIFVRDDTWDEW
ncbi:putative ATP synthase F0, A subunit, partial [Ostertagia ostertagi]